MSAIETLMETELVDATAGETVAEVSQRMADNKVGAVLVRDGEELRGIFSERDLLQRVVGAGRDPQAVLVGDVMSAGVVSLDVATPVKRVLETFRDKGIRHVPVTRNGKPAGILSMRDFLTYVVEGLERFINEARYNREIAEGSDPYDHLGGSYGK